MFSDDPRTLRHRHVKNSGLTRVQEYLQDSEARRKMVKGGSRLSRIIDGEKSASSAVASTNPVDVVRNSKKEEYLRRLEEKVRQGALDPDWVRLNSVLQISEQSHTSLFQEFNKMLTQKGVQPEDERGDHKTHAEHKLAYQMAKLGKWKPMTEPEIREAALDRFYYVGQKDEMKDFLIECHSRSLRAQNKKKQDNLLELVDQIKLEVSLQKIQERRQKEKEIEKIKSKETEVFEATASNPDIRNRTTSSKMRLGSRASSNPKVFAQIEDAQMAASTKSSRVKGPRMASFNFSSTSRFYDAGAFKQPSHRNLHDIEKTSQTKSEFNLDYDLLPSARAIKQEQTQRSGRVALSSNLAAPDSLLPRLGKSALLKPFPTKAEADERPYKLGPLMEPSAQQITQAPSKSETVLPGSFSPQSQTQHVHSPLMNVRSFTSLVRVFDGLSHRAPINHRKVQLSPSASPGKAPKTPKMAMFYLNKDAQQQVAKKGPSGLYKVTDILRQQQTKALRSSLKAKTPSDVLVQNLFPPTSRAA